MTKTQTKMVNEQSSWPDKYQLKTRYLNRLIMWPNGWMYTRNRNGPRTEPCGTPWSRGVTGWKELKGNLHFLQGWPSVSFCWDKKDSFTALIKFRKSFLGFQFDLVPVRIKPRQTCDPGLEEAGVKSKLVCFLLWSSIVVSIKHVHVNLSRPSSALLAPKPHLENEQTVADCCLLQRNIAHAVWITPSSSPSLNRKHTQASWKMWTEW